MKTRITGRALTVAAAFGLVAATAWAQPSKLYLKSQVGDYIGGGQTVTYTDADGTFSAFGGGTDHVAVSFQTPGVGHWWTLDFGAIKGQTVGPGMYEGSTRYPFQSPTHSGLDVSGDGRGCNTLTGRFVVLEASFDLSGKVLTFAADFEQHCEGGMPALYGALRFHSSLAVVPRISIGAAAVVEGPAGAPMTFTISLSQPAAVGASVAFATADGTALAGSDYVATSRGVALLPGQTSVQVTIPTLNDHAGEGEQQFSVNLANPKGAPIAFGQATGRIVDGDGLQTFMILDSQTGDYIGLGQKQTLTVLDGAFGSSVTNNAVEVRFESDTWWDASFAAPGHAVLLPGTYEAATRYPFEATSAPGLSLSGDGRGCNSLTGRFVVHEAVYDLSGNIASFAADFEQHCETPTAPALYGAIRFNTTFPITPLFGNAGEFEFSAPTYTVSEGAAFATITVKRTKGDAVPGSVGYSTEPGSATAAGLNPDYAATSGTLAFGANQTSATFQVPITKDYVLEANETVVLRLLDPQPAIEGASLGPQSTAVLTIVDNDLGGKIQLGAAQFSVNAATADATANLTVKRTGGLASGVTVHYAFTDGTAAGGVDYDNTPGDLTFPAVGASATTQTIPVKVFGNPDQAKGFTVTLSSPMGGAVLGAPAAATVTILGALPTLAFGSGTYSAKTTQPTALITVKRSAPSTGTVTVHFATSPGTAVNGGGDYTDVSGDLTFGPNVSQKTFTVPITKDPFVDPSKTVNLTLSSPTWSLGTAVVDAFLGSSVLTIMNPNLVPTVQFSAASYTGNEAMASALITVKRTGDLAGTVTVAYGATGGTATNGGVDYTLASGVLTFPPNVAQATIPIAIVNDTEAEGTETVGLTLSGPTWTGGAAVVGALGTATLNIIDNEPTVQFSAASYTVSEVAKSVLITVKRTGPLTAPASVDYDATGGTAVRDTGGGGDYALSATTLTFAPGASVKTFTIALETDTLVDGSKTIELALFNPVGAKLGTPRAAVVTIKDDDIAGKVQFSAAVYSVTEKAGQATITVTRSVGTSSQATIRYATLDGDPETTAQVGTDYTSTSGTITFGLNQKSARFAIPIADDGAPDVGAVAIVLSLDTPGGGLVLGSPATATLWIVRE